MSPCKVGYTTAPAVQGCAGYYDNPFWAGRTELNDYTVLCITALARLAMRDADYIFIAVYSLLTKFQT